MIGHLAHRAELLLEARPDGLDPVVLTLDERRAVEIAHARHLGRMGLLVVDVAVGLADPAARHPPDELIGRDIDLERLVDPGAVLVEGTVEGRRLGGRAREAVEDDTVAGVGLGQPVEEHPDRDVVGDQLAALHVSARLETDRAAFPDGRPEQVAGRDVRDGKPLGQDRRLGALAGAGGAQQDQEGHRMNPS